MSVSLMFAVCILCAVGSNSNSALVPHTYVCDSSTCCLLLVSKRDKYERVERVVEYEYTYSPIIPLLSVKNTQVCCVTVSVCVYTKLT